MPNICKTDHVRDLKSHLIFNFAKIIGIVLSSDMSFYDKLVMAYQECRIDYSDFQARALQNGILRE